MAKRQGLTATGSHRGRPRAETAGRVGSWGEAAGLAPATAGTRDSIRVLRAAREPRRDSGPRIRVLVVEDRQLLAEAVAAMLRNDPGLDLVGTLTDPRLVLEAARQTRPDVVLIDYFTLTQLGELDLTAGLREELPGLKMVVLTQTADEETLDACLRAGASGQVTKDRPPAELIDSLKRVHGGEVLFAPSLLVNLVRRDLPRRRPAAAGDPPRLLAPRERAVLQSIAAGLSTEEVAATLGITAHTVRSHLKNVMSKLDARTKLEAVLTALKAGYIELR